MKCDIEVLKEMKEVLLEGIKESGESLGVIHADGTSAKYQEEFYKEQLRNIRNPQDVLTALENRAIELGKPFHSTLIREYGEVITLNVNGKEKSAYLVSSALQKNADVTGGIELVVGVVEVVGETPKLHRFSIDSDTSLSGEVSLDGISDTLKKTIVKTIAQSKSDAITNVKINTQGFAELKGVLNKLADSNEVLGAKVDSISGESLEGYEQVKDYEHGDIDSMRKIMHKLHVLGNSKADKNLLAYYDSLLGAMHPRFFNKLKLFTRKTQGTTDGKVILDKDMMLIDVAPNEVKGMSEAEVYVHEVVHTMTSWALRQTAVGVSNIRSQLQYAMEVASENMRWQDFLDTTEKQATTSQIALAKRKYEYVFGDKTSVDEFIAYTLTNPAFMEKMKNISLTRTKSSNQTVFERVSDFFIRIVDVVLGRYEFSVVNFSVFEQVNKLAFQLGEVNDRHRAKLDNMNPIGKFIDVFNSADTAVGQKMQEVAEKIANKDKTLKVPKDGDGAIAHAKFFVEATIKAATNPLYRGFFGLGLSAYGLRPESSIREIAGSFTEKDDTARVAERLKMSSEHIDSVRNSQSNAITAHLIKSFSRPLTDEEDSAITRVLLDTGLSSIRYSRRSTSKLPDREILRLLENEGFRQERVEALKQKIREMVPEDSARSGWTINQALGLGYYLATHKSNISQNFNAKNIELGYGRPEPYESVPGLAKVVEELAAVTALGHSSKNQRMIVAELIRKERKGINEITDTYESYRRYSEDALFNEGNEAHMMMGHSKELFDASIDITVAPVTKRAELERAGYEFRYELRSKNGDKYDVPMAMFTTPKWGRTERLKGAIGLGTMHSRGTTISSLKYVENSGLAKDLFARDFANVQSTALKLHKAMESENFNWGGVDFGMGPVLDSHGRVTDYRYMMSKEEKERLFEQDTKATAVLGRSIASITDSVATKQLNERVLSAIRMDMKDNWEDGEIGVDGYTEYYLIGPKATDKNMQVLYYMLPESFKEYINNSEKGVIAVRKELLYTYFGYKHLRLTDMVGINLLPQAIKNLINIVEGLWLEFIKISKMAILMKMPLVLIQNLIDNIKYMITTGSLNVVELAKDYTDSFKEVSEYIRNNREILGLDAEIRAMRESLERNKNKTIANKLFIKETKLKRLVSAQEANPAKKLFDAGMYQSYIEDVSTATLNETNEITKAINKQLGKAPKIVQTAANIAYITQNTAWYKISQEVMQRTDMVARLAENKRSLRQEAAQIAGKRDLPRWWLEGKPNYPKRKVLEGNEKREFLEKAEVIRMEQLRDNYINYTKPNGRGEEYLNRIGVLMFTKYLKRVQNVIFNSVMNNPVKSAISLGISMGSDNYAAFQEQSLMARMFGPGGDVSVTNIVPTYGLLYHIDNVFTPPIVKDELYLNML